MFRGKKNKFDICVNLRPLFPSFAYLCAFIQYANSKIQCFLWFVYFAKWKDVCFIFWTFYYLYIYLFEVFLTQADSISLEKSRCKLSLVKNLFFSLISSTRIVLFNKYSFCAIWALNISKKGENLIFFEELNFLCVTSLEILKIQQGSSSLHTLNPHRCLSFKSISFGFQKFPGHTNCSFYFPL